MVEGSSAPVAYAFGVPWRGRNGQHCHGCDRHVSECGPLSARYRCVDCGVSAMLENATQLREHRGPRFDQWRLRSLAGLGDVLVDAPEREA